MKKIFIFILFLVSTRTAICQTNDTLRILDIGIGGGYDESLHGSFNIGFATQMNSTFAYFFDYNANFDKTKSILLNEFSLKAGPYFRIAKKSYISISFGLSGISKDYHKESNQFYSIDEVDKKVFLIGIPVQLRINFCFYKGLGIGLKGVYNKVLVSGYDDIHSFHAFICYHF